MKKVLLIISVFAITYCVHKVMAEYYWTKFSKSGDVAYLQKVLDVDPKATLPTFYMAMANAKDPVKSQKYVNDSLYYFNGDIVLWSIWMQKGQNDAVVGNIYGAKDAFERALYYWPKLNEAKNGIASMKDIINGGKPIMIQFGDKK